MEYDNNHFIIASRAYSLHIGPSGVANRGLTFVFDIRHPNWYIATRIRALSVSMSLELDSRAQKLLSNRI
jgi:hypothetical protein